SDSPLSVVACEPEVRRATAASGAGVDPMSPGLPSASGTEIRPDRALAARGVGAFDRDARGADPRHARPPVHILILESLPGLGAAHRCGLGICLGATGRRGPRRSTRRGMAAFLPERPVLANGLHPPARE